MRDFGILTGREVAQRIQRDIGILTLYRQLPGAAGTASAPREATSAYLPASSSPRAHRSATMATSNWLSSGSFVVIRCSHNPGAMTIFPHHVVACFAENLMNSYAMPPTIGMNGR